MRVKRTKNGDNITIDVCMPTLNCQNEISDTLENIYTQVLETKSRLLIADGGSRDETIKIINRNAPKAEIISFCDNSPEEGINKMFQANKKNAKLLIGADDRVSRDYLASMKRSLEEEISKGETKLMIMPKNFVNITRKRRFKSKLPLWMIRIAGIGRGIGWLTYNAQGVLDMDESLQYASDYEYLRRCKAMKYRFRTSECEYYHCKQGRSSNSFIKGIMEEYEIALKYRHPTNVIGILATGLFLGIKAVLRGSLILIRSANKVSYNTTEKR